MVVIAGLARKRHPVVAVQSVCPNCHRESVRAGIIEKRAFTIFWIPLVPLGSSKKLICLACGGAEKVKRLTPLPYPEVPPDQVRARIAELRARESPPAPPAGVSPSPTSSEPAAPR